MKRVNWEEASPQRERHYYKFNPSDAERFANQYGKKVHHTNDSRNLAMTCPYCGGGGYKFTLSLETGQFHCFHGGCGISGNMLTLAADFDFSLGMEVDEYLAPRRQYRDLSGKALPSAHPDAVAWLEGRGIRAETVERYNITAQTERPEILVFPFADERGVLQYVKYRDTTATKENGRSKEWSESGCKPILFGMAQCNSGKARRLIITEGQIDALSVAQAGNYNVVSVPNGKDGWTWVPYCYDWVRQFDEIIVFGDYEKDPRTGETRMTLLDGIKQRFPMRVLAVKPEAYENGRYKDANDILKGGGTNGINAAIAGAEFVGVKRVKHLLDAERVNLDDVKKLRTGIFDLDVLTGGGIQCGVLSVLQGKRGEGKSTLAIQMAAQAVAQGMTAFIYSGEATGYELRNQFERQVAGPEHIIEEAGQYGPRYTISETNAALIRNWCHDKVYYYDNQIVDSDEPESLLDTLETAIQQYGIQFALIDNLMTGLDIDGNSSLERNDRQGQFVTKLARMAVRYDCLIMLVAHLRKNSFSEDPNDEASGSAEIGNRSRLTLQYARGLKKELDSGKISETQRKLSLCKCSANGNRDYEGMIMDFEPKSRRIYKAGTSPSWKYGWEPEQMAMDGFVEIPDEEASDLPW